MSRLFRILNDNETIGVVYDSKEHTSPRKQEIIRLWDPLKAVCRFSKETGISLLSKDKRNFSSATIFCKNEC